MEGLRCYKKTLKKGSVIGETLTEKFKDQRTNRYTWKRKNKDDMRTIDKRKEKIEDKLEEVTKMI